MTTRTGWGRRSRRGGAPPLLPRSKGRGEPRVDGAERPERSGGSRGPRSPQGGRSARGGRRAPTDPERSERALSFQSKAKPETRMKGGCPPVEGGVGARSEATRRARSARRQSEPRGVATATRGSGRQPGGGAFQPPRPAEPLGSGCVCAQRTRLAFGSLFTRGEVATVGGSASRSAMQSPQHVKPTASAVSFASLPRHSRSTLTI